MQSVGVMLCVALLSFSLFNFVGDPINNMVGEETSTEERAELRETLGLNDPIHIQFGRFVVNAAQFNFGKSYQLRRPVSELIAERMPATLELVIASSILALGFGVFLGVYTGINRTGVLSNIILFVSLAGVSLPTFVIGILFIYIFAVILGVLPSFGRGEVVQIGFWSSGLLTASGLKALILPSLTLSLFQMTYIIRLVRAEIMEILQTDYIKFARHPGKLRPFRNTNGKNQHIDGHLIMQLTRDDAAHNPIDQLCHQNAWNGKLQDRYDERLKANQF